MRLEGYKREQRNGAYLEGNITFSDFFLKTVIFKNIYYLFKYNIFVDENNLATREGIYGAEKKRG